MISGQIMESALGERYEVSVKVYDFRWRPNSKNIFIEFFVKSEKYYGTYVYNWSSTPSMGLATVTKDTVTIYDPYSRTNSDEGHAMLNLGREISQMFEPKTEPHPAP